MSMQVTKVWWDGGKLMAEPINESKVYKPAAWVYPEFFQNIDRAGCWTAYANDGKGQNPDGVVRIPLYRGPQPLTGGDDRRHIICLCPDCTRPQPSGLSHPNPENTSEASADAEIASHAKRLALELECLLLSCDDTAAASKWWTSAHEALEQYQADVDRLYPQDHVSPLGKD